MFGGNPCLVPFVDVFDVLVGRHVLSGMCLVKDMENGDREGGMEEFSGGEFLVVFGLLINSLVLGAVADFRPVQTKAYGK